MLDVNTPTLECRRKLEAAVTEGAKSPKFLPRPGESVADFSGALSGKMVKKGPVVALGASWRRSGKKARKTRAVRMFRAEWNRVHVTVGSLRVRFVYERYIRSRVYIYMPTWPGQFLTRSGTRVSRSHGTLGYVTPNTDHTPYTRF